MSAQINDKRILYYLEDSRAFRVAWTLEELDLAYELKQFRRIEGKKAEGSLKQESGNPLGKSPFLVDGDDIKLGESAAIVRYLAERYGTDQTGSSKLELLGPVKDWQTRGDIDSWMSFSEGMMIHSLAAIYPRWFTDPATSKVMEDKMSANVHNNLNFLESALSSNYAKYGARNGEKAAYLVGQSLTAADITCAFSAEYTFGMDVAISSQGKTKEDWPHTLNWLKALAQRPAYQRVLVKGATHKFTIR